MYFYFMMFPPSPGCDVYQLTKGCFEEMSDADLMLDLVDACKQV